MHMSAGYELIILSPCLKLIVCVIIQTAQFKYLGDPDLCYGCRNYTGCIWRSMVVIYSSESKGGIWFA